MNTKKIGCIFDMDGVLFLSSEIHFKAFQETLAEEPAEVLDYRELAGLRTDFAIQKIYNQKGIALSPEKLKILTYRKRKYASKMLEKNPPVAKNCNKVIGELSRRGVLLALASSSSSQNVNLFLESSGTRKFFKIILSGDDIKKPKPDPEIFQVARKSLGLQSSECLVVEDSENGIRSAKAAGINAIGVLGENNQKDFELFGVTRVITKLDELLMFSEFQNRDINPVNSNN